MISGRAALPTDTCPHGKQLGDCTEAWCRARVDDLLHGEYEAKPLAEPETVDESRSRTETAFHGQISDRLTVRTVAPPRFPLGAHGCIRCGAYWTGNRPEHCTVCHQTFGGETAGNKHRYGTFDPPERKCHDAEWMRGKGWHLDEHNVWRLPAPNKPITYGDLP